VLALEHADRQQFIEEISAINRRMNESASSSGSSSKGIPLELWG
jgi:hypothetical protein